MTKLSRSALFTADENTLLPDNTTGAILPEDHRDSNKNIHDSFLNLVDDVTKEADNSLKYLSDVSSGWDSNVIHDFKITPKKYVDLKALKTTTLTINGTSFDISTNRSWNVGDLLSSGSYSNPTWITSLDGAKITGTIPLSSIPASALERIYIYTGVETLPENAGLTTSNVQNGDVVKMQSTGLMYVVADDSALNVSTSFVEFTAGTASSVAWSGVTGTPTTLGGYGITDAQPLNANLSSIAGLTGTGFLKKTGVNTYSLDTTNYLPLTGGTLTGSLTATSFVKSGGTSNQVLMADGSVTDKINDPYSPTVVNTSGSVTITTTDKAKMFLPTSTTTYTLPLFSSVTAPFIIDFVFDNQVVVINPNGSDIGGVYIDDEINFNWSGGYGSIRLAKLTGSTRWRII
jgi:hypothetical protein